MLPREFWDACAGYNKKVETEYRAAWDRTRWMAAIYANTMTTKTIQPTDLIKFPWDGQSVDRSKEIELIKERRKWRKQ